MVASCCAGYLSTGLRPSGSANRLGGSRESKLAALRVSSEEQLIHLCFASVGARLLLCFLMNDSSCSRMYM